MSSSGRLLFTQPETLLAICGVTIAYFATQLESSTLNQVAVRFVHVASFGLQLGMSFWVTFVAGLTMGKVLPRHQFSLVQSRLFPKYFTYGLLFNAISLATLYLQFRDSDQVYKKMIGLLLSFIGVVVNCAVLTPLLNVIEERNKIEIKENVNNADESKRLRQKNKEYDQLYSRFVKLHGISALANLLSVAGIVLHACVLGYSITFV